MFSPSLAWRVVDHIGRNLACNGWTAVALLALGGASAAQASFVFAIDQANSNFQWTGTSTLGPIVGNPSNTFQFQGTQTLQLTPAPGQPVASGLFLNGDAKAVPDLHGKVPNPIPILPPLATIDMTNLRLSATSPSFPVGPTGSLTTTLTLTALSGTLTVTPLGGSPSNQDLTGQSSLPTAVTGSITQTGANLHLNLPIVATFTFSDPGTGASGSITVSGTLNGDWTCSSPSVYCTAKVNSLGCTPSIGSSGTPSSSSGSGFIVSCTNVRNNKSGLLFYGVSGPNAASFQGGTLCVAPAIKRTPAVNSGGAPSPANDCSGLYSLDMNAFAVGALGGTPLAALTVPGTAVNGQFWGRDPGFPAPNNTTLSNGLAYVVCP